MKEENYWSRAMRRRLTRRNAILGAGQVGLGIVGASVIGCSSQPSKPATTPAAGSGTGAANQPKKGGSFHVAGAVVVQNLDPHYSPEWLSFDMWRLVSNGVLKQHAHTYEIQPDLAESWENPDPTTFVFKLRKGAKFQNKPPVNGREFTSEDVKFTIDRISTKEAKFVRNTWFNSVDRIEMPDKYTAKFILKQPYAPFLTSLSALQTIVAPKECVEKFGDLAKPEAAIGTGPFMLEPGFRLDVGGVWKRNPDYFVPDRPYMDEIRYEIVEDASSRLAAFRTGKHYIGGVGVADYDEFKARKDIVFIQVKEAFSMAGLGFNMTKKPFDDVRVRKAIHLAIDRQQMINTINSGFGMLYGPMGRNPAWGLTEEELLQLPGFRADKTQDLAEAKKLLAEAGFPNGFEFTAVTTESYSYTHSEPAQIMKQNLTKIGVTMNLEIKEWGQFKSQEQAKSFAAEVTNLSAGATVDPDSQYAVNYRTGGSRNYWGLSDPELDKMIDAQAKELDIKKRQQLVREVDKKILDIMPMAYHTGGLGFQGYYDFVKGLERPWSPTSYRAYQWVNVWLDK